nr:hypothetical protein [Neisseria sp. HSC-16F19]
MCRGADMRGGDKFRRRLREIAAQARNTKVRVGIVEQATYENGQSVAQVAFWNEYGTAHIPPRPFFRNTIAENKDVWPQKAAQLLQNNDYDIQATLAQMGEGIQGDLVESIQQFTDPANAASTVKRKGFDKPLIDSGTLWRSIGYEVSDE